MLADVLDMLQRVFVCSSWARQSKCGLQRGTCLLQGHHAGRRAGHVAKSLCMFVLGTAIQVRVATGDMPAARPPCWQTCWTCCKESLYVRPGHGNPSAGCNGGHACCKATMLADVLDMLQRVFVCSSWA